MKLVRTMVVAAVAALPLIPTAAQADTYRHADSTTDVQSVVSDAQGHVTDTTATAEPTATNGDVSGVRAINGARSVKVILTFRELNAGGLVQVHEVAVATRSKARIAYVSAYGGHWGGKAVLRTPGGKKVRCSVGHHISYGQNKVVVTIPQSCLGHAKVIKVGAATLVADGSKVFYDDAFAAGGQFNDPFVLSPRIHR